MAGLKLDSGLRWWGKGGTSILLESRPPPAAAGYGCGLAWLAAGGRALSSRNFACTKLENLFGYRCFGF
jgi:hypothetical protein